MAKGDHYRNALTQKQRTLLPRNQAWVRNQESEIILSFSLCNETEPPLNISHVIMGATIRQKNNIAMEIDQIQSDLHLQMVHLSMAMLVYGNVYIYIYVYPCIHIYIYLYILSTLSASRTDRVAAFWATSRVKGLASSNRGGTFFSSQNGTALELWFFPTICFLGNERIWGWEWGNE